MRLLVFAADPDANPRKRNAIIPCGWLHCRPYFPYITFISFALFFYIIPYLGYIYDPPFVYLS